MQPFPEDWGRDLGHLNSVFEAENGFAPLDASLPGSSDHGTATTVDADEMRDPNAPKKSLARRGAKNPVQHARQRATNNAAVSRYREKKRQEQEEVAAMVAKAEDAIAEAKQEQTELSYVQSALTKMAEYANDVISTISQLVSKPVPHLFGKESSSKPREFVQGTWINVLTSFSAMQLRHSITRGLLSLPPDAMIRYQVLRMDVHMLFEARAGFSRKINDLTTQYDSEPALRGHIEGVIEMMFHLWVRAMKVLVEDRPELLHQAIDRLSQREAKSPEAMRAFLDSWELKPSQRFAIAKLHREHSLSATSLHAETAQVKEMARQMSETETPSTLQGLSKEQLKLFELLSASKELTVHLTDSIITVCFRVVNQLSAIQLARLLTFYYPNVPDMMEIMRAIDDDTTRLEMSGMLQGADITNREMTVLNNFQQQQQQL